MDPPHFLLDVLSDSVSSGTFIDTKFYVFSRRDADGRVDCPRALYCNSRILDTVPYFSSLFSDGFSEGQQKDINGGFPSGSHAHTEDYDYLSDSDLEDGSFSEGGEEEQQEGGDGGSQQQLKQAETVETVTPDSQVTCASSVRITKAQRSGSDGKFNSRLGKVAIIPDMAALTFEALLYYLYTGEIKFASFSSYLRRGMPAEARVGDWGTRRPPSPSAKSIYRLADKYDIPALKEQAKAHICNNLEQCDIVEEVFSSFTYAFPEILSTQVSFLVKKMREESAWGSESATRKRLRNKIASLPRSQMGRATDVLVMIWNCVKEPLEPPMTQSGFNLFATPILFPNWHRVKVAFLKSIATGVFIDVQFYAYNKILDNIPVDPKPLFTSSIVIEEWWPAITTQTTGINSESPSLADGPFDDYEGWRGELSLETRRDEEILKCRTEAAPDESREAVLLVSGAWKTWMSLFSYAYRNEMTFSSLHSSGDNSVPMAEVKGPHSCSPRSVYSLAETLGIVAVRENALKSIQSSLSVSNIAQELFSSFTASHKAVMATEIEFFHKNVTGKDPKLLVDYIQGVACGQTPFFPTTLSMVYDGLFGMPCPSPETSGVGKFPGGDAVITPTPLQGPSSAPAIPSSSTANITSTSISTQPPVFAFTCVPSFPTITKPSATILTLPTSPKSPVPTSKTVSWGNLPKPRPLRRAMPRIRTGSTTC